MNRPSPQTVLLFLLAAVFTVGLTFASIELPHLVDRALMRIIATPAIDSHADDVSLFKTELYIRHYELRTFGYVCFALTVLLIVAGFTTRKSGFAAVGAVAFMLPVFAQFAAVMFFLAGLGVLNVLWLPVLDISFEVQRLGLVIRAPYDLMMWFFRQMGVNAYWPIVIACIGGGLILFFLGTWAWLSVRARDEPIARSWVYRISRHPQYLGWIVWSYGLYLLLLRGRYPKRSWGIDASLPWLVSTMVIVGVALLEEIEMRRRYGESYDTYRRRAPFLFPLPGIVSRFFALPFRVFYGRWRPERRREVAVVLCLYTALLVGASAIFYGGGWERAAVAFSSDAKRAAAMQSLATQVREHPSDRARSRLARELAAFGEPAVASFVNLLGDEQTEVRALAAQHLGTMGSRAALPALLEALEDPSSNVRYHALRSLGTLGAQEAAVPIADLLEDPDEHVRRAAIRSLAELGSDQAVDAAIAGLNDPSTWSRIECLDALGRLGSRRAVPAIAPQLEDGDPLVRRAAVVALAQISGPQAQEALRQAARDTDWEVRVYAAEALKQLDSGKEQSHGP